MIKKNRVEDNVAGVTDQKRENAVKIINGTGIRKQDVY